MAASPEQISPRAASTREDEATAFASNAGHRLLAQVLEPLEEMLAHPERFSAEDRERLEAAHRSCLRLRELGARPAEAPSAETRRLRAADDPELVALREAQAALRASEEKFSTAFGRSPLALTITSLEDGRLVEVNEGFVRLSGYPRDEAVGRRPEELGLWVEPEVRAERFARLRSGQPVPNIEARFRIKNGDELIGVIGSAVVEINGRPCVLSSVTDITERKKAEIVLHRQNERLVILSEALAGLLGTRRFEPITRELFPKVAAHLGVDTYFNYMVNEQGDALILRSYAGLSQETARQIERLEIGQAICGTVARTHQPVVATDVRNSSSHEAAVVRSLGIQAYACHPLMNGDRLLGTLSFASRTRERFDDDELEFLRLISGYVALAMERVQTEEALKEADRRKDEFLAMLAHELRNPLAPIRNAVHVLKLLGPTDAREQWAREIIERQTQHLTRLVDDLLDVSRITRGKITLAREPLELAMIVHRAVEASRPLIDARHHRLTVVLPPDPVRLEGDLTRLVQVVGNLLNNAAKYTDEGGHIRLEAAREGGEVVLRVRDDGLGLPADLLPHVFDLFTQADRSLDRSQGGLGIGLTLVRQLVEMHGGRVEAKSDGPGRGSEFIVRLPAAPSPAAEDLEAGAGEREPPASRGLRILVVEDNVDAAEMMALCLNLRGHDVRTVHDGPTALEAARAFAPQVVLCDIGLPGMSGYEVAVRLREQPAFHRTPLIALTGYGQEEARCRSREAGFDYHLVKPVEPDALEALLDSLREARDPSGGHAHP